MATQNFHTSPAYQKAFADLASSAERNNNDFLCLQRSLNDSDADVDDIAVIAEVLRWIPPCSRVQHDTPLACPIALPQVQPNSFRSGPMPFYRAYAPSLAQHDVSCQDFMAFVDNLTIAQAPAAPFQLLQVTSTTIGFVPHHWAQAASAGIGMAAGVGSAATSVTRVKLYLKRVNEQYFRPRGLRATILCDAQLVDLVRADPNKCPLAPINEADNVLTIAERRMKALGCSISPLDFQVPPPTEQTNVLNKLAAKQVKISIKKSHEKAVKQARKSANHFPDAKAAEAVQDENGIAPFQHFHASTAKMRELELRIQEINLRAERQSLREDRDKGKRKVEEKREKDIRKARKEFGDASSGSDEEKRSSRKDRKNNKKENKKSQEEIKQISKLKWIVIDNWQAYGLESHQNDCSLEE